MSETGILYPPLPPPQSRSQHFQKNCAECTRSHRRCIFVSVDHPKCTRCTKMHLLCCFVPSRESIYFHVTVLLSIFLTFYLFFSTWLDQGRRNDIILKKSREQAPPPSLRTHPFGGGLWSDDCQLTSGISERVHYPPSIHSRGLRGSSCCAVSKFPGNLSNLRPLSSHDVTTSSQAWFHVYSHMTVNCSQRTQCAAIAHLPDGVPSSICRSRICCAKKKLHKQQCLLRKIVPPLDILNPTVSIEDIDKKNCFLTEVTPIVLQSLLRRVFNGDVFTSPIFVSKMIYEVTLVSPSAVWTAVFHLFDFHGILLSLSLDVAVSTIYMWPSKPVKIYALLSVGATRNVSSLTSAGPPAMHVLDLRYPGIARRYSIIRHSWTNYHRTIGSHCFG